MIAAGCSTKSLNLPDSQPQVRSDLPKVTQIRSIASMTAIGLEWKMVPDLSIEGYDIYRLDPGSEDKKLKRVARIDDRYSTHYVDTKLKPGTEYIYQMATYDKNGDESLQSAPHRVRTAPMIPSVSFVRAITQLPHRIKLIWRPHQDFRVVGYVIERADVRHPEKWEKIATVKNRLSAEYMDKNLGDGVVYMYRVRCKLCNGLITPPSEAVKAITKPLPLPPVEIHATHDLPRMIRVTWKPSPTPDVVYYKVYRAPFAIGFYTYRAKVKGTEFDDRIGEDGKEYYYKVTAVDKDGLESEMPEAPVVGATLGRPLPPLVTTAQVVGGHVELAWQPRDDRARGYEVIRSHWDGLIKKKKIFKNLTQPHLSDLSVSPGVKYTYQVIEIDANGIKSEPSKGVDVYLPKVGE